MRGLMLEWDAPTTYPIDLTRIKTALRISHDEFDAMIIDQLLPASLEWVESTTRRSVVARAHTWVIDQFPLRAMTLPRGKTQSVASITYSSNGSSTTLTGPSTSPQGTDWQESLKGDRGALLMPPQSANWPSADTDVPEPVVVTFTAGWLVDEVPQDIVTAMLLYIGEHLDILSPADLGQYTDTDYKEMVASAWRLPTCP